MLERAKIWNDRIKTIGANGGRIGEICLSEEETLALAKEFSNKANDLEYLDRYDAVALCVLVVNLAYYYYQGGWESVLKPLIGGRYKYRTAEIIGQKIEDLLIHEGIVGRERPGTRYLGLVLRQAIVTRLYINGLKYYLQLLDRRIGFERLNEISFETYARQLDYFLVPSRGYVPSGILLEMLHHHDGFSLVKAIATSIDGVRTNHIVETDLNKIPGFRPGFWDELKEIIAPKAVVGFRKRFRQPLFKFSSELKQVGILFDPMGVAERRYRLDIKGHSQIVDKSFVSFERPENLAAKYEVRFDTEEASYCVRGWKPTVREPGVFEALFREEDGLLMAVSGDNAGVRPGSYYLIVFGEPETDWTSHYRCEDYGYLDIEGDDWFTVWRIELGEDAVVPGLCKVLGHKLYGLSWTTPHFLNGTDPSTGIFVGSIPTCLISGWEVLEDRYQLVKSNNGKVASIPETELRTQSGSTFLSIEEDYYRGGSIRLDPVGVSSIIPNPPKLDYFLLPKGTSVRWTYGLIDFDEPPWVECSSPDDLRIVWDVPAKAQEVYSSKTVWTFEAGTNTASGRSERFKQISFSIKFSQADVYPLNPPEPTQRQLVWSSSLESDFWFIVRGHSDTPLSVGIEYDGKIREVWKDTEQRKSKARVSSAAFRDGISVRGVEAGRFLVEATNGWRKTPCIYVNEKNVLAALFEGRLGFVDYLPGPLTKTFEDVAKAIKEGDHFAFDSCPYELPQTIARSFRFIKKGVALFDRRTALAFSDKEEVDFLEWLVWYNKGLSTSTPPHKLLQELPGAEPSLPVDRWNRTILALIASLRHQENVGPFLEAWAGDVDRYASDSSSKLESEIGMSRHGEDITRAAVYYRNGAYADAWKRADKAISGHNRPVDVISEIIRDVSDMKKGRHPPTCTKVDVGDPWDEMLRCLNAIKTRSIGADGAEKASELDWGAFQILLDILQEKSLQW